MISLYMNLKDINAKQFIRKERHLIWNGIFVTLIYIKQDKKHVVCCADKKITTIIEK